MARADTDRPSTTELAPASTRSGASSVAHYLRVLRAVGRTHQHSAKGNRSVRIALPMSDTLTATDIDATCEAIADPIGVSVSA